MTEFDYIVLTILLLSVLLGWWRGLVHEILSLLSWGISFLVAKSWGLVLSPYMPDALESDTLKSMAAFLVVFLLTLILCGLGAWSIYRLAKYFGLDWRTDGVAGAMFGAVRGLLIVLLLVVMAGLTKLPQTGFWKDALLSKPLQTVAMLGKDLLPEEMARLVTF